MIARLAVLAGAALVAGGALAQPYPSKAVKLVVPFAAGGAVDTVSRIVGQRVSEQAGVPVVIEHQPGASANLGADFVAKAAPDGYTVLMGANGLAANMTLFQNLPFDTVRDFAPVARVGYAPLVLVLHPSSPARTFAEFVSLARSQPGKLTYGSSGIGGSGHLATELLRMETKTELLHVPYKGGSPALADLVGGRLSLMLINPIETVAHVKAERLRALAVSSDARMPLLPDTPTFAEAGMPGFRASVWWGLVAPAKTPPAAVQRLADETLRAMASEPVKARFAEIGAVSAPLGPDAFRDFLRAEIDTWSRVIKAAGIRAE